MFSVVFVVYLPNGEAKDNVFRGVVIPLLKNGEVPLKSTVGAPVSGYSYYSSSVFHHSATFFNGTLSIKWLHAVLREIL